MAILEKVRDSSIVIFWCPGCDENHQIDIEKWEFNGDYQKPTFEPSYLTWLDPNPAAKAPSKFHTGMRCHSFIRDGKIQYLSDCSHKLAGQTVRMVELP